MDGNAIANIHLALTDKILSSIEEKKSAKEIWDHLTKLYEAKSLHNKIFLKRKLYTLRMSESTSMTEHINTLNTLFSQLNSLDYRTATNERAEILVQIAILEEENRRMKTPIKRKTDVFETFKTFKVHLELESGKKMKCLRTENEGDYTSSEFGEFCKYAGIKRQYTTAYTPQRNGVAKRMNRTLLERTRAMLGAAGLDKSFWANTTR
ncbi:hypothetical protein LIER_32876 [Lithospermum erythrorhizon]|uniref:Integrase catalytic domain-containing protein n=1 Tax=Lithospermum erythrorhizon TaxID=34254 RepID=A0AAV3RWU8_LITER